MSRGDFDYDLDAEWGRWFSQKSDPALLVGLPIACFYHREKKFYTGHVLNIFPGQSTQYLQFDSNALVVHGLTLPSYLYSLRIPLEVQILESPNHKLPLTPDLSIYIFGKRL